MNGTTFKQLSAIVMQFVMQEEYEKQQEQEAITEAAKLMFENAEEDAKLAIINNYIQQIKDVDFAKTPLTIFFRRGTPSFKSYQQTLKEKLDSYEHISELYIQYKYYDTFGQSLIYQE